VTASLWCQRWADRRLSWKLAHPGERIDARRYEVQPIDETARRPKSSGTTTPGWRGAQAQLRFMEEDLVARGESAARPSSFLIVCRFNQVSCTSIRYQTRFTVCHHHGMGRMNG
jgi:hypothetical protein